MTEEPLIPVPIPPLIDMLTMLEKQKGSPLTEHEVLEARDKAICMNMPLSQAKKMAELRGYADIDPDKAWRDWQSFRESRLSR